FKSDQAELITTLITLYLYSSFNIMCASHPKCSGTFTALAIITTFLVLIVISIRLEFLAIEFSCGFVLDFIRYSGITIILNLIINLFRSSLLKISKKKCITKY